jgi:hypothetical protein
MLKFSGQSRSSEVVNESFSHQHRYKRSALDSKYRKFKLRTAVVRLQDPSVNICYKRTNVSLYFHSVDPQANVAPGIPEAAICVQVIAAQYILQFAIVIALCCALHRSASRVIHRSECLFIIFLYSLSYLNNE